MEGGERGGMRDTRDVGGGSEVARERREEGESRWKGCTMNCRLLPSMKCSTINSLSPLLHSR